MCERKFTATRKDARYCSGACRQRASRARASQDDLTREIEAARLHYWALIRQQAEARGMSHVETAQARFVAANGDVRIGFDGPVVGRTTPFRRGWAAWGLEAAGPPFCPPPGRPG
ncbi:MAG: hypothetical protein M3042_12140 [Actinomycetota bacterium]|nr:hypothetical protein [Actinomycetota bacterium]